jgi:hypothetical protein
VGKKKQLVLELPACSVAYFQKGLNDEKIHPVDDPGAADRHVALSR